MKKSIYLSILVFLSSCKSKPAVEQPVDAWYKHLIIYNLDVKTFKDSDGDGEGDFRGLTSKLGYLKNLGINTIWLAPFQSSPLQDDGYDVTDYKGIDPKLGNADDFKNFMRQAKVRHLKVIMDVALNHTSIRHPWFRRRPDWYVWSDKRPSDWNKGMGFPVVEKDTWHLDFVSHQYYFHRFYFFEPDLNYQNPEVIKEAESVLAYWLDCGLDGFRLDAVPFTIDDPRKDSAKPRFDFNILHELAGFVKRRSPQAVLLGEANVEPRENEKYFAGHHEGLQMMFNFYANQYLFLGFATGNAGRFKKALTETQVKPGLAQWAWFLRNHDEIDLGRLSKHDINLVYKKMGPDTNMQLYKRGIRRRLATMLGGDARQLHLAYSLLFSLPGTPVIRQGEEIGMGDDLRLKERLSIRTPMQWDSTFNGGFTSGIAFRPVISSVDYGYQKVNVARQLKDPQSLLRFIQDQIERRKSFPEIDNGNWQILKTPDAVLALLYAEKGKKVLMIYNFSENPQQFSYNGKMICLGAYSSDWRRVN
jgi:maltose alpha-D-glucosyltransferase/alpha-amylase